MGGTSNSTVKSSNVKKKRIISLDVFRGLAVAAMIFVNAMAFSDFTPGIFEHAAWNGLTFADLVFPSFLFIVGVSMAYSFAARSKDSKRRLWGHFLFRVVALFTIGVGLSWFTSSFTVVRIPGVLQLIALSSLCAAPMARSKPRWILLVAAILLIVHSFILLGVGAPGIPAGTLEQGNNVDDWLDVQILTSDHTLNPYGDPEGILSIITATALVLLGLFVGRTLQLRKHNWKTIGILMVSGTVFLLIGVTISLFLPIIKQLWTSSFILVCAGIGTLFLTLMFSYLDLKRWPNVLVWAIPMGLNALVIYILSIACTIPMHMDFFTNSIAEGPLSFYDITTLYFTQMFGPAEGMVVYGLLIVLIWLVVASVMHWRRIYIKL
nr:heparan-alpha-glucosaminide N-acetyltransferase domain-containing protein [uncultured Methanobacterium sp.]